MTSHLRKVTLICEFHLLSFDEWVIAKEEHLLIKRVATVLFHPFYTVLDKICVLIIWSVIINYNYFSVFNACANWSGQLVKPVLEPRH